jgi:hypothetical protein
MFESGTFLLTVDAAYTTDHWEASRPASSPSTAAVNPLVDAHVTGRS